MGFWTRKPAQAGGAVAHEGGAPTARWTNGNVLSSKLVTVVVAAAIACGPIALFVANGSKTHPVSTTVASAKPALSVVQQSAGAFAVGLVSAWLSATQTDSSSLDAYVDADAATFATTPYEFKNMAVASIDASGSDGLISVVVAADVKDASITDTSAVTWPRRYFRVTVSDAKAKLAAVTLPAPVAGPPVSDGAPSLGYSSSVASTGKLGQSVMLFLAAYLTGQGETEPYTSPSTSIPAINPAPYSAITATSIAANHTPADAPADGDKLSVLATVALQNAVGQSLSATYALELRARAGRWEVASLDAAPLLAPATESISSTPSSTDVGNQKGK